MMIFRKTPIALAVTLATSVAILSGCGGSSSNGEGESANRVSRGLITGFGSVYVNGQRFRTESSRISIEDSEGDETDLRVGMIVTVHGTSADGGDNWDADSIDYDNELKGPVSHIEAGLGADEKLLTLLGQTVLLNLDTTIDDDHGLTFDNIAIGDVIEVSGYRTATGLVATHIEMQDNDDDIEIRGIIENLGVDSFTIRGFAVSFGGSTEFDDIDSLEDGLYVEVEGRLDGAGTRLIAEKIEAEDDGIDDDADETELAGVIYDYDADVRSFRLQNLLVDAASAELSPSSLELADGVSVKVEGYMQDGVLIADEIERKGKKVKISAALSAVGADRVSFSFSGGEISARINAGTEFDDDTGNPANAISDFSVGDFVELKAYNDGAGALNVVEIERKSPDDIEIEAPVEAADATALSVQLLGVGFDLSAASFEDDDDRSIDAMTFFAALDTGVFVELKDEDGNGVIDEADLED